MKTSLALAAAALFAVSTQAVAINYLDSRPLGAMTQEYGSPRARQTVEGKALVFNGKNYSNGIGTHSYSAFTLRAKSFDGTTPRFKAKTGLPDSVKDTEAAVEFLIKDGTKILWRSGVMKPGDTPKDVDLAFPSSGILTLITTDGGNGISSDHAVWIDAHVEFNLAGDIHIEAPNHVEKK